jgi:flagellar M-ring protein FliF
MSASGGGDDGSVAGGYEDAYGQNKRMYEQEWEAKIRDALRPIPGVNVAVNVELNPELEISESDTKVDKPVAYDVSEFTSNSNTQGSPAGGRPGLAEQGGINVGGVVTTATSSGPKNTDEKSTTRTKNAVSTSTTINKRAPLTPRRVAVTVGVLSSYFTKIWEEQNPTPPGSEPKKPKKEDLDAIEAEVKDKITKTVTQLVPLPQNSATTGQIEVTPLVTVVSYQQIPQTQIQPPSFTDKGLSWLNQYWSTIGMLCLGMISLLVLRSMVRAVPAPETPRAAPALTPTPAQAAAIAESEQASPAEVQEAVAKLKRRVKSGPSMRDELVEVVREDPDTAANILRSWIGSAT